MVQLKLWYLLLSLCRFSCGHSCPYRWYHCFRCSVSVRFISICLVPLEMELLNCFTFCVLMRRFGSVCTAWKCRSKFLAHCQNCMAKKKIDDEREKMELCDAASVYKIPFTKTATSMSKWTNGPYVGRIIFALIACCFALNWICQFYALYRTLRETLTERITKKWLLNIVCSVQSNAISWQLKIHAVQFIPHKR